jgi:hypothetical protein
VIGFVTSFYVVYVKTNPPVKIEPGDDAPS